MRNQYQDTDYFVPVLAPYVHWVSAHAELIPSLYEKHKTVRRTWKAFKEAIPGVEQRLEFSVFEQILLFSLFLAEWYETYGALPGQSVQTVAEPPDHSKRSQEPEPDSVIQELRNISDERDKLLWNLKDLEEKFGELKTQEERLEDRIKDLEAELDMRRDELHASRDSLQEVVHELDAQKDENEGLRLEVASLCKKQVSMEERIRKLVQKAARSQLIPSDILDPAQGSQGGLQMVIQWAGQTDPEKRVGWGVQNLDPQFFPKKVGRWNAQLSKDGYYRLYRKIRGRVHSIYLGKELDFDKARAKIAEKEKKLLGVTYIET
jgi:cell division protein FtsB